MDKQEFRKMFSGEVVYNDKDWFENSGLFAVQDICRFWNKMKRAGAVTMEQHVSFVKAARLWDKTRETDKLFEILDAVLGYYDCMIAQNKATLDETVVEQECFGYEISDLIWESKQYRYAELE